MIVAYLTEPYYKWAVLFLKSFKLFHGSDVKIHLNTRDLKTAQISTLKEIYTNIIIENRQISIKGLSKKHNISERTILESKNDCEGGKTKGKHRLWMNLTADDDRIVSLYSTILKNQKERMFLHTDIDMLFRGDIRKEILEDSANHDIGLILRHKQAKRDLNKIKLSKSILNSKRSDSIIAIGTVTITNNEKGKAFVKDWVDNIVNTPIKKKSNTKWGQYAILKSYIKFQDVCNFWRFPVGYVNSKLIDSPSAKIWYFRKKRKNSFYPIAEKEFKRLERFYG